MIEYELEFTQDALDDIQRHKKSGNKPLLKKLEKTKYYDAAKKKYSDSPRIIGVWALQVRNGW